MYVLMKFIWCYVLCCDAQICPLTIYEMDESGKNSRTTKMAIFSVDFLLIAKIAKDKRQKGGEFKCTAHSICNMSQL